MSGGNPGTQGKIQVLDAATANQIAAGEVVERPASVVKELVENAIDAGARAIRIDVKSDAEGVRSIRVTDDGCGMPPEDAPLAFAPHATSKIRSIRDLDQVRTLGFRGEALASIAAVAKVTLVTREQDPAALAGTRIVVEGGRMVRQESTGAPAGTSVFVEDLFFNTPARKKFQKSRNTELAHIHAVMEGICLACPEVSFRLFHNGHEDLVTDRTTRPLDTVTRLFGPAVAGALVEVTASRPALALSGYVARPSLSRKDNARLYVSVNGRYVTSPVLAAAVREGYGTLLPKDRSPVAFLALTIDTVLVDVNVHPAKKLVRLSREPEIAEAVREAVRNALLADNLIPAAAPVQAAIAEIPSTPPAAATGRYTPDTTVSGSVAEPTHAGTLSTDQRLRQTELAGGVPPAASPLPDLDFIGTFGRIYLLAATPDGELVIIDQHAAHERIFYELAEQRAEGDRVQELIAPVTLHRTAREAAIIRALLPLLAREGFIIEEFGQDTFLVRAVPVVLGRVEDASLIDDLISDLVSGEPSRTVTSRERILRVIACKGAIKAGTACTPEQCRRLLRQLRGTRNPFTCPHGRPTMIRFSRSRLDEMFLRS